MLAVQEVNLVVDEEVVLLAFGFSAEDLHQSGKRERDTQLLIGDAEIGHDNAQVLEILHELCVDPVSFWSQHDTAKNIGSLCAHWASLVEEQVTLLFEVYHR